MEIKGYYRIADCEHRGDIESAVDYVTKCGCNIVGTFWDGHDCGDAYVDFTCNPDVVRKLYKSISFHFDCNISELVDLRDSAIMELKNSRYNLVSGEEYDAIRAKYVNNYDDNFLRCLPIELTFEMKSYSVLNTPYNKVYGFMCHNYNNMLKVMCCKVEGDKYTFLLLTDFDKIESALSIVKEGVGKDGEVKPIHLEFEKLGKDIRKLSFWDYMDFKGHLYRLAYGEDAC